jgi:hypothetical protein
MAGRHTQTTKTFCLGDLPRQKLHVFQTLAVMVSRSDLRFLPPQVAEAKFLRLSSERSEWAAK